MRIMLPVPARLLLATLCCLSLHTVAEADTAPAPKRDGPAILVENGCTDAIPKLTEVIRTSPNDSLAFNARGNCYRQANDPNRALADYQAALRLEPNRVTAWISVATAYNDLRNREQALLHYQRARTLDPANARAAEGVGAALYHLKRDASMVIAAAPTAICGAFRRRKPI
jgi:Tfp pilus assembly protein PilF